MAYSVQTLRRKRDQIEVELKELHLRYGGSQKYVVTKYIEKLEKQLEGIEADIKGRNRKA